MKKFSTSFKRTVNSVANNLGLTEITSERQNKNGTLAYKDPQTDVIYTLHSSGYIRRHITFHSYHGDSHKVFENHYQLNPQKKEISRTYINGRVYRYYATKRVMLDPWGQLGKLTSSVISYRKSNGN